MRHFRFYHKDTGIFHPNTFATTDVRPTVIARNTPADHVALEGEFDHRTQRFDIGANKVVSHDGVKVDPTRRLKLLRIDALRVAQHDHMRRVLLGIEDKSALAAIDDEITALQKDIG